MDQKQKSTIISAMIKMLVVVYIVIFIVGMVKLFNGSSPGQYILDLTVIFVTPVVAYFLLRSRRKVYFPTSIAGLAVSPEGTKKALIGRIRAYILDSLQYAVVVALFISGWDIWQAYRSGSLAGFGLTQWLDTAGAMLIQFMGFFAVYFAMDYIMYEFKASRYMQQQQKTEKREEKYKKMMEVNGEDDPK